MASEHYDTLISMKTATPSTPWLRNVGKYSSVDRASSRLWNFKSRWFRSDYRKIYVVMQHPDLKLST